jgi:hypothetical protein
MDLYFWIPFDSVVAFVAVLHNEGLHVRLASLGDKNHGRLCVAFIWKKKEISLGSSF